ncbi:MAG: hypothetical protein L3J96_03595 [Thermoplasmata archaeon]|nr:hypothetical protein [Thermoplasmata archaeon]
MGRLVHGQRHPSTEPLSPEDEQIVRDWILIAAPSDDPDLRRQGRTIGTLFRFGMHPIVLGQAEAFNLKYIGAPRVLAWRRAKTYEPVRAPLRDEEVPWLGEFVEYCHAHPCTSQNVNRVVHAGGDRIGMPYLSARSLRHDTGARALDRGGFNAAKALLATTDRITLGYGKRADGRRALQELTDKGF